MIDFIREEGKSYRFLVLFFATGWGSGYCPVASGTAGTIFAGIPTLLIMSLLSTKWYLGLTAVIIVVGAYFCEAGDRILGEKDSSKIVIDEVAGFLVTMAFVPLNITTVIAGFLLFRIFDIIKIQPAKWTEDKLPGGIGVMADDIVSGIYANILLQIGLILFS